MSEIFLTVVHKNIILHIGYCRSSTLYYSYNIITLAEVTCFSGFVKCSVIDLTLYVPFIAALVAFGTQVRGFNPGRSRRVFQGEKIISTLSFGREVKPFVPCRRFTTCKRSLNVTWKSGIFKQNSSAISRPSSSSFHY